MQRDVISRSPVRRRAKAPRGRKGKALDRGNRGNNSGMMVTGRLRSRARSTGTTRRSIGARTRAQAARTVRTAGVAVGATVTSTRRTMIIHGIGQEPRRHRNTERAGIVSTEATGANTGGNRTTVDMAQARKPPKNSDNVPGSSSGARTRFKRRRKHGSSAAVPTSTTTTNGARPARRPAARNGRSLSGTLKGRVPLGMGLVPRKTTRWAESVRPFLAGARRPAVRLPTLGTQGSTFPAEEKSTNNSLIGSPPQ